MEKYEALASQLEESYKAFMNLIQSIDQLQLTFKRIESTSSTIANQYEKALDPKKLKTIEQNTQEAYKTMQDKIKKLNDLVNDAELMHQSTHEAINQSLTRIEKFGSSVTKSKTISQEVDKKLAALIQTAEKQKEEGERQFIKASTLFDANREIEKYDELLKLERDNNKMLKELLKVMKPFADLPIEHNGLPFKPEPNPNNKRKPDSSGGKPHRNR
ncbi:MAG: hypothetical protein EA374_03350 [Acholeplasmatales bacterium]|nr:MAG: hypothetical protein EA374_03350 [Acholeplasmatales bacterium]